MIRPQRDASNRSASAPREVNNLLHTLRGEQFRQTQNLLRSSREYPRAVAPRHTYNEPSLPFSDIYKYAHTESGENLREDDARPPPLPVIHEGQLQHGYPRGPIPGPPVPKSWSGLFHHSTTQDRNTLAFRREALSLIFSHIPWSFGSSDVPAFDESEGGVDPGTTDRDTSACVVPPLAQICLSVLLSEFPDAEGFGNDLLAVLPPHFRRDVLRYTAVHDPLPNAKLYPLCGPEGDADGELIVIGPHATLQRDLLAGVPPTMGSRREGEEGNGDGQAAGPSRPRRSHSDAPEHDHDSAQSEAGSEAGETDLWEAGSSSSRDTPPPLHTLIALNTHVPSTTLFIFPLTITRLALLALPAPTPVHRLPRICPLLEVLDLSYNSWLNDPPEGKGSASAESMLERTEWEKWTRLLLLGLRECSVPQSIVARVNKGRWEDVQVVGVDRRTSGISLSVVEAMMKSLRLSD